MFFLTKQEVMSLKSQFATSSWGGEFYYADSYKSDIIEEILYIKLGDSLENKNYATHNPSRYT